jgi:hypothetical protein
MPSTTQDVIDAFERTREDIVGAVKSVPASKRRQPFVGHWSLLDVLTHLVGWDYTNIHAVEEFRQGTLPSFYRQYDPGWDHYNSILIDRYGTDNWGALLRALDASGEAVVTLLRSLSDEEFNATPVQWRGRPVSIAAIMRAAVRDEREHLQEIWEFANQDGQARFQAQA